MAENVKYILVVVLIQSVKGQVFSKGKCPEVTTQASLDLKQYMGKWYEVYRFPTSFENSQTCNGALYTLKENGHVNVTNFGLGKEIEDIKEGHGDVYIQLLQIQDNATDMHCKQELALKRLQTNDGSTVTAQGDGYVPDEKEPARLLIKFSEAAPYGKYWVLDTDYKTHSLIYSCSNVLGISHIEFSWILSRNKSISDDLKKDLFTKLENFKIKAENFQETKQIDCPPF